MLFQHQTTPFIPKARAHTIERCQSCDNGIDSYGCQCRKCHGRGYVNRYLLPKGVWSRPRLAK